MNIVILAGGVGTRLWPLGRKNSPKQFFPMISKKPLVKETYDRFTKVYGPKKIFFSVTKDLLSPLRKLFPNVSARQFIVEPSRRDTGPAMGYVALQLFLRHPDEPMVFVPSDHFVADQEKYLQCFLAGERIVKETGKLADIGITATFPSTVLGYTKIGRPAPKRAGVEIYEFAGHTEKPDSRTATQYVTEGHYLWHGNYYMWTPRKFLEAIHKYAPEIGKILDWMKNKPQEADKLYEKMPKVSFDYAVTEKISKQDVLIIKGDFGWSDVGAWDVLHSQLRAASKDSNVSRGKVIHLDSEDCLLYGHGKKVLAAIGLKNMVVVDTKDALLVCPKDRAQDVKKLFPEIEKKGWTRYL